MNIKQIVIRKNQDYVSAQTNIEQMNPDLVILFGNKYFFNEELVSFYNSNKKKSESVWIGCSTAGEIYNKGVIENSLVITCVKFNDVEVYSHEESLTNVNDSFKCGEQISAYYDSKKINFLFILGKGLDINGSALLSGIHSKIDKDVLITGGLASDGLDFKQTFCFLNGKFSDSNVVSFGLKGKSLKFGYSSYGGWKPFGPIRKVTKSTDNILYELDGESALRVYKKYLGGDAVKLPASGLRYPFAILNEDEQETGIIRTILGINEVEGSLILAGDVNNNQTLRLMHADVESLVDGARVASIRSDENLKNFNTTSEKLSILVSCIGRKIIMGEDVDDEIDAIKSSLDSNSMILGFYSNGEFCPLHNQLSCKLHNQTMTITQIME